MVEVSSAIRIDIYAIPTNGTCLEQGPDRRHDAYTYDDDVAGQDRVIDEANATGLAVTLFDALHRYTGTKIDASRPVFGFVEP